DATDLALDGAVDLIEPLRRLTLAERARIILGLVERVAVEEMTLGVLWLGLDVELGLAQRVRRTLLTQVAGAEVVIDGRLLRRLAEDALVERDGLAARALADENRAEHQLGRHVVRLGLEEPLELLLRRVPFLGVDVGGAEDHVDLRVEARRRR